MKKLKIDLADRAYEIGIGAGLLDRTGEILSRAVTTRKAVMVTHPKINRLYGDKVLESLRRGGFETECVEVPEGEESKSLREAGRLYDRLVAFRCDRRSVLVALGGGVIGDLTGFAAATYMRGIPFIQVPTTLLAQVDSSVGGKTGVNHPRGKNLIGAFHQPRAVVIDIETLRSLPAREFRAGMAEVIKYGVIADPELFEFVNTHAEKIMNLDTGSLEHIIETSCAIKASVVERDERESQYRMVLNFGHTYGHAVEALTGYSGFVHGEAVALGMVFAARLSHEAGKCSGEVCRRIKDLVEKFGLPAQVPGLPPEQVIERMYLDKKTAENKIKFILVREIGDIEIVEGISESLLRKVLEN